MARRTIATKEDHMATEIFAPAQTEEFVPASPFAETFQLSEREAAQMEALIQQIRTAT